MFSPTSFFPIKLVRLANKSSHLAVKDITFGFSATYAKQLADVLHLRNALRHTLHPETIASIDQGKNVVMLLLGLCGYEFTVGILALVALGAVVVPISLDLPVKEANYFATTSRAAGVLTAEQCAPLGQQHESVIHQGLSDTRFQHVPIRMFLGHLSLPASEIQVSSDPYMDLNKADYVIFTSDTIGPPKGTLKRRGFLYDVATQFSDNHGVREGDVMLHRLSVHHATGITVTLLPFLWSGGTIEFRSGGFDTAWTWERIRQGNLAFYSGVPTIYLRLMQHYERHLSKLTNVDEYVAGVRRMKHMICGTSALPRPLQ
jgi:malonyl-CoA/methylmalonyl-CoA synthetase